LAQRILSLQDIAPELVRLASRAPGGRTELREAVVL
jgi:hypothetical protein